jgi:hypothetical protein
MASLVVLCQVDPHPLDCSIMLFVSASCRDLAPDVTDAMLQSAFAQFYSSVRSAKVRSVLRYMLLAWALAYGEQHMWQLPRVALTWFGCRSACVLVAPGFLAALGLVSLQHLVWYPCSTWFGILAALGLVSLQHLVLDPCSTWFTPVEKWVFLVSAPAGDRGPCHRPLQGLWLCALCK